MSAGFAILCIGCAGIPLWILYVVYGPTTGRPVVPLSRASLAAIPHQRAHVSTYQPEAVFAVEEAGLIQKAQQIARVMPAPRLASPPPTPRQRMARGSAHATPPPLRQNTVPDANPFADEAATYVG
ncbi:MAG: hypothetical protein H0T46_35850 [Deltaproteobacteria bacterium]|nr:hypothetical protein [Deltaproteobacteria bacterium]